ncbi:MAG: FliH/SctL family protein [Planctomycetota bacterium]
MSRVGVRFTEAPLGFRVVGQEPAARTGAPTLPVVDALAARQQAEQDRARAVAALAASLQAGLPERAARLAARLDGWTGFVLDLAFGLAERVLGTEIDRGRYDLAAALRAELQASGQALGPGVVRVHLHPEDCEELLRAFDGRPSEALGRAVELERDPAVPAGGYRVESDLGLLRRDPAQVLAALAANVREEVR